MIGNLTMIEHVWKQVQKTGLHNIYVATDSEEIGSIIAKLNGKYILIQNKNIHSGTDRVHVALPHIPNHENIKYIINVQGDLPFLKPETILNTIHKLKISPNFDIVTPVVQVKQNDMNVDEKNNVKVVTDLKGKVLYFSRSVIPNGGENILYHVGIYGYKKAALNKFVEFPQSVLEKTENLEQLRALENGMIIGVIHVQEVLISVDTKKNLEEARMYFLDQPHL